MFAAFPAWYATLFSALYLALLLVLVALIARGVAFEFRGKVSAPRWRRAWTWATTLGSGAHPAACSGIGLGDMVAGLPIDAERRVHRQLRRHLHRLRRLDRADAALAVARCTARRSWRSRPRARCASARATLGVSSRLAARRRRARLRRLVADGAERARGGRGASPRALLLRRGPRGLGVHRDRGRDGRDGGSLFVDLYPERAGLEHRRRLQPDRRRRRVGVLRAEGDDRRRGRASCRSCCSTRAGATACSARARPPATTPRSGRRGAAARRGCRARRRGRPRARRSRPSPPGRRAGA